MHMCVANAGSAISHLPLNFGDATADSRPKYLSKNDFFLTLFSFESLEYLLKSQSIIKALKNNSNTINAYMTYYEIRL